jgi:hypothetical protein
MDAIARRRRRTASLIFVIAVVLSFGPLYAQKHAADELASLRAEVSQLYEGGNYTRAIPLAELYVAIARVRYGKEHTEFATAIALLASVYYARAVSCLGAETRPEELPPVRRSP